MPKRNYKSREFLLAQHEADQARIAGLLLEIKSLKFQIDQISATYVDQLAIANAAAAPRGRAALMAEAKRLAQQGTACYVRGEHIYAAKTREVLV